MAAFDATLNVIGINVQTPEDEEDTTPHLMLSVTVGQIMPFSTDGQQPMIIPIGTVRYALDKEAALGTGKKLLEEGGKLPEEKESDLLVASSLSEVEEAAKKMKQATGT